MFNKWNKTKSYLFNKLGELPMGGGFSPSPIGAIFMAIGAVFNFLAKPAVQLGLFVAQGVSAHRQAMKAKRTGAEILLQKYGTGAGMPVIYGTRRVAGTVVYMNTINNRELFVVYALAGHEIDSFDLESLQIDGRTIKDTKIYRQGYDISDGTNRINFRPSSETRTTGTFWGNTSTERANITGGANTGDNARMTFNCHKGTTTQAADPMLEGIISEWTSNHKLTGITYIAANYEYDIQGMFTGIPNLTVVVNGKKVYDPRTATTGFSSNPALCLLDYLTDDEYGKGLSLSDDIDTSSFSTAANDCDVSADTITHSNVVVERASTTTDRLTIANANEDDYNNFKVGNKFTISDGVTTYVSDKKLIDKDTSLIDIEGANPTPTLQLTFESGAVGTAITSNTTCTFTETQIRFDCNGVLDTDETVLENTKLLVANMRGIFTYAGGKYSIKVEGTESSVVSLDEDDILESGITLSLENKEAKYNKVEAEFYNAQKKYETDTTYYTGETSDSFLSDDGDEVLETRIQLPFCTNQRIAYNHAKAMLKRSRSQKTISFVATPKVLKAKVGEVISITNSNLNLSSEQYRITNMVINPDLNISVNAIEYQTAVYDYVTPPDEEIGIGQDPVDGNRVEAPTNLQFTAKDTSTGEPAKLTWTDSSKYPSYEFRVVVKTGNTSTIPNKTRFDRRTQETFFYLDGINIDSGFTAFVSALNSLGVESDAEELAFAVTTAPVTTPDIEQGSIGGFSFTASKMYHPVDGSDTGVFETSNVYIDDTGQFSLKDKLSFDGTTLNISGNLTVENTITADKIVVDGINLDNLISASTQSGSIYLTEFTGIKIATSGSTSGYPPLLKLQDDTATDRFTDITQSQTGINIRARAGTTKGTIRFQGRDSGITPVNYGGFDSDGNWEIGTTDVIKSTRDIESVQSIALDSNTPSTTTNKLYQASGTLYWNGNQVGVGAINSVTNMADNRVLTASGSNSANGEANLTFDGSTLDVNGNINITEFIKHRGDNDTYLQFTDDDISLFAGGVEFISMNEAGSDTITLHQNTTASGNLIVSGDLTVNGTTTTLNTATLDVEDKNITLNYSTGDSSASANGAGITIQDAVNSTTDATILWDAGNDEFDFSHTVDIPTLKLNGTTVTATATELNYVDGVTSDIQTQLDSKISGNQTITLSGDVSGSGTTSINVTVADDSHNHIIGNVDGLQTALDSKYEANDNVTLGTISSGAITSSGKVKGSNMEILGASGSSGFMYIFDSDNGTSNTDGFLLQKSGNNAFVYNRESSGSLSLGAGNTSNYLVIDSSGNIDLGSTQILDQSRNLTNIGTISSGAITSSGQVYADELRVTNDSLFEGGIDAGNNTIASGAITTSDRLTVTGVGSDNTQPSTNYGYFSGYGFIGNRGTVYITNGGGNVQIGNGNVHNSSPTTTFSTTGLNMESGKTIRMNGTTVLTSGRNLQNIGTIDASQSLTLNASGTNDTSIEIGANTASNHYAFIDLVGDATYTDYGLRIIRNNGGANTSSFIYHRGTGNFNIETQDSAAIKLRTAGTDALTVDTSQRVGIGTTSPASKLHLQDGDFRITGVFPRIYLQDSNNNPDYSIFNGNGVLRIYDDTNAADRLAITTTGVGIGTTSPAQNLHISDGSTPKIRFARGSSYYWNIGHTSSDFQFESQTGGVIMHMNFDGNVGIGTTSPDEKLHVHASDSGNSLAAFTNSTTGLTTEFVVGINSSEQALLYNENNTDMLFATNDTERLRIDSSGGTRFKPDGTNELVKIIGGTSYNENIRMHPSSNGYGSLVLGAVSGDSGTGVGQWTLVRYPDANANLFTIRHNSTNHLAIKKTGEVGIGTISPAYKLDVSGSARVDELTVVNDAFLEGDCEVSGNLTKGSGSFKIDHPLKPDTHHLVHSFVESPQADNIYSGQIELVNGRAEINLDIEFNMTEGTIVALNRGFRTFTTNESDWDNVKGSVVDNILTIVCQNPESDAEVSWLVIGERQDKEIHESSLTDDHGKVIVEPSKNNI